jgi:hypothetical protein
MKNGLHTAEVGNCKLSASDRVSFLYHEIRDKIKNVGADPVNSRLPLLFLKLNEVTINSGKALYVS